MFNSLLYRFKNFFATTKYEYVYVYILSTDEASKEGVSTEITNLINLDLSLYRKRVKDADFFIDLETYETLIINFSDSSSNVYFIPIMYESYAYFKKNKDKKVFSYKIEDEIKKKVNIKEIGKELELEILKFKIKC